MRVEILLTLISGCFSAVIKGGGSAGNGGIVNVGPVQEEGCPCTYSTVWLDVMVIVEASKATTAAGTEEMFGYVQTNFAWLNLQKSNSKVKMSSRVGVVTYGPTSSLVAPLGSVDNFEFQNMILPFSAGNGNVVDLEGAVRTAISELSSTRHRTNTRKVIVLMASTYNPFDSPMPSKLLTNFKEQGGVVIAYNYIQTHGGPAEYLKDLASPGFFMNNINDTKATSLDDNLCIANCFCPIDFIPFAREQPYGFPSEDCYIALPKPSNYSLADKTCDSLNGYLAMANSHEKSVFLRNQWNSTMEIWAGLSGNPSKGFTFVDMTPMNYYRPWRNNDFDNGTPCVSMGIDLFWKGAQCSEERHFACQASPCNSQKYCELDPSQQ